MQRNRLETVDDIRHFIFAGNAILTLESQKSGEHLTFKVSQSDDNEKLFFVALLSGPNNQADYNYMGLIRDGVYSIGRKSKITAEAKSQRTFTWLMSRISQNRLDDSEVHIYHEGHCGRCARPLTVPESLRRGIGPDCAKIMGVQLECV